MLQWLFPTSLTAVARLVAALRMPTVRLRYLRARAVTPPAEYERLLALLGCADARGAWSRGISTRWPSASTRPPQRSPPPARPVRRAAALPPAVVRRGNAGAARADGPASRAEVPPTWPDGGARRRGRTRLQAAPDGRGRVLGIRAAGARSGDRPSAPAAAPRLPFAADLTPAARPVAIDGSRELVDGGNHREAVFWVVATAARCQAALNVLAPALAAEREQAFRALVADLTGLRSPTDVLTRRDALLADLAPPATG